MVSKIRGGMVDAHWFACLPRGVRCGEVSIVNKIAAKLRAANVKFLFGGRIPYRRSITARLSEVAVVVIDSDIKNCGLK
jgi:hypothetical protein